MLFIRFNQLDHSQYIDFIKISFRLFSFWLFNYLDYSHLRVIYLALIIWIILAWRLIIVIMGCYFIRWYLNGSSQYIYIYLNLKLSAQHN